MPWYELRVRGRLESASRLVPGFQVVEQVVTTVLTGRVDNSADIQPVLAEVQALGLDVMEFHQVPERPTERPTLRAAPTQLPKTPETSVPQIEVVAMQVPTTRVPSAVARVLNGLAKDDLVEVVDVACVELLEDATPVRRSTPGLPKRLEWQMRRGDRWVLPVDALAPHLEQLDPDQVVLAVALRARSAVELLDAAVALSGGKLVSCLRVPVSPAEL